MVAANGVRCHGNCGNQTANIYKGGKPVLIEEVVTGEQQLRCRATVATRESFRARKTEA
jgi:hypothetical protein